MRSPHISIRAEKTTTGKAVEFIIPYCDGVEGPPEFYASIDATMTSGLCTDCSTPTLTMSGVCATCTNPTAITTGQGVATTSKKPIDCRSCTSSMTAGSTNVTGDPVQNMVGCVCLITFIPLTSGPRIYLPPVLAHNDRARIVFIGVNLLAVNS